MSKNKISDLAVFNEIMFDKHTGNFPATKYVLKSGRVRIVVAFRTTYAIIAAEP
jgi:hypothetical protein